MSGANSGATIKSTALSTLPHMTAGQLQEEQHLFAQMEMNMYSAPLNLLCFYTPFYLQ